MNVQLEAAYEIHLFLAACQVPYAIIGGFAVQCWGEPRFTQDVDVTILVPFGQEDTIISAVLGAFTPRVQNAAEFARKNRVILARSREGCDLDISLGIPGYEEQVTARAFDYDLGDGRTVKLCSAEDLIIHKAVAGRPQDDFDIEGIILRQGKKLDVNYIARWLEEFARSLETQEILLRFTGTWERFLQGKV